MSTPALYAAVDSVLAHLDTKPTAQIRRWAIRQQIPVGQVLSQRVIDAYNAAHPTNTDQRANGMTLTRPSDPVVSTCPTCGWSTHPAREGHARNALRRHSCPAHLARTERSARHQERLDSIDRTPQPCRHPIARHQHGTRAAYVADRCRCQECSNANTTYEQRRVRAHAFGRWTATFVDAEPARRHVNALRAAGLGRRRVAALAGVSTGALGRLLYGHVGGPPSPRISTTTADHLLAVPAPALAAFAPGALVDAVGTRRRIQALAWVGWSIPQLATRAGIDKQSLHRAIRHDQVTAATATAIRDLYDELWNVAPTPLDRHASAAITRTRNRARAEGWHPPMAWDDIDDANETPTATTTNKLSRTEYCIDTTAELLTFGVGPDEIARRLNVQPASLQRVLHRAGRGDLASQLIRTIRRTA